MKFTIQKDWKDCIQYKTSFWLSCYPVDKSPVHSSISEVDKINEDHLKVSVLGNRSLKVQYKDNISCGMHTWSKDLYVGKTAVNSIDLSHDTGLIAAALDDGRILVYDTVKYEQSLELTSHLLSSHRVKFFPSGKVLLSGGMDMQVKIWDMEDGECARSMKGHKGSITDLEIIDRGKNVLSSSKDGFVRRFECSSGSSLLSFNFNCCINAIQLVRRNLIVGACENGSLLGYDVDTTESVFSIASKSKVINSIKSLGDDYQLLAGDNSGTVSIFDVRNSSYPVDEFRRSSSSITAVDINRKYSSKAIFGCEDGTVFSINHKLLQLEDEYVSEYDCIRDIKSDSNGSVYAANKVGHVYKY